MSVSFSSFLPSSFFLPSSSSCCQPSTASRHVQCSLPDLKRDPLRSVFPAGPQPRPSAASVPCWTSTAAIWAQCSLPDLNRDHLRSVFRAGPQPRDRMSGDKCQEICQKECQTECQKICQKECRQTICQKECQTECQKRCQKECQKECQKICQKEYQKICQKMSQRMRERMSEDMSDRMSEDMPERVSEEMSEDMSEWMSDNMSERMSDRMSEAMSERRSESMPEGMSDRMSEDMSERMSEDMSERISEDMSERMSEDMSDRMSEDMSERMWEDMAERMSDRMSGDMPERMSERVSEEMSERMSSDNMSERMSDRMPEAMSERMSEDMSERISEDMSEDVRKNVRRYVRKNVTSCKKWLRVGVSDVVWPHVFRYASLLGNQLESGLRKTLSAWQEHFKGSLKALHENSSVSQSIAFLLPPLQTGRAKELPVGWLIQRKAAEWQPVCECCRNHGTCRTGNWRRPRFHLHRPGGQRFTSLQQALQYAQNDKLRNRLAADMKALQMDSFDHNSNIHVQFTSNHEGCMHRGCFEMSWWGSLEVKYFFLFGDPPQPGQLFSQQILLKMWSSQEDAITATDNVLMAFVFGIQRGRFPLTISMRACTEDGIRVGVGWVAVASGAWFERERERDTCSPHWSRKGNTNAIKLKALWRLSNQFNSTLHNYAP